MVAEYGKNIEGPIQKDLNWFYFPTFYPCPQICTATVMYRGSRKIMNVRVGLLWRISHPRKEVEALEILMTTV